MAQLIRLTQNQNLTLKASIGYENKSDKKLTIYC
jgi:hypothetical protein